MNFQNIPPVDTSTMIIDVAFKRGGKHATEYKPKLKRGTHFERQGKLEQERLKAIAKSAGATLSRIVKSFPSIDALPELYARLIDETLDTDKLKQSLASVATAARNTNKLAGELGKTFSSAKDKKHLLALKRQAIGRVSSVVKRVDKQLLYLEKARKIMRDFPAIKPEAFTVAIAGFPNVGKSTLLNKLTGSKAEIDEYAFTTKTLNAGSFEYRHNKIQCIDTPGTLARLEKMNPIEKQAYLAMKYAAHMIVYIYDLTEEYPVEDQERLEKTLGKYGKEIVVYLSKTDILEKELVQKFRKKKDSVIDVENLKKQITEIFEDEFL
ncbi:GTP-binding protein [Candidatus Woesearchaeota archaeon]|nr:GTP-binding protein [Candidatus Woesearchaeota archaeon]